MSFARNSKPRFSDASFVTPGPGAYDPKLNIQVVEGTKTSAFGDTQRFGDMKSGGNFGPGYYDAMGKLDTSRKTTVGAKFRDAKKKFQNDPRKVMEVISQSWKVEREAFEEVLTGLKDRLKHYEDLLQKGHQETGFLKNSLKEQHEAADCQKSMWRADLEKLVKAQKELEEANVLIARLQQKIVTLEGNLSGHEQFVSELQATITKISEENSSNHEVLSALQMQHKNLEEKFSGVQEQLTKVSIQETKLQDLLKDKAQKIESVTTQYNNEKIQWDEDLEQKELSYQKTRQELAAAQSKVRSLSMTLEAAQQDLVDSDASLSTALNKMSDLEETLQTKTLQYCKKIEQLNEELEETRKRLMDKEAMFGEQEKALDFVTTKKFELEESMKELQVNFDEQVSKLEEQNNLCQTRDVEIAIEKEQHEATLSRFNAQVDELNNQISSKQSEIREMSQSKASLEQQLRCTSHALDEQTSLRKTRDADLVKEKEQREATSAYLNAQISELKNQMVCKQSELGELSQSKASLEQQLQSTNSALDEQTTLRETRDAELATEKEQHAAMSARFDAQVGEVNNQMTSKQSEIRELLQSKATLEQQLQSISSALDSRDAEIVTEKKQSEEISARFNAQIGELNDQINSKESKIRNLLQSKASLEQQLLCTSHALHEQTSLREARDAELVTEKEQHVATSSQIGKLNNQISNKQLEIGELSQTKLSLEEQLDEQTSLLKTRDSELAVEKEQHKATSVLLSARIGELISSKQSEIGKLSQNNASLQQQLQCTSSALDEQTSLRETRDAELATKKEQHEATSAHLNVQIDELNNKINSKQSEIGELLQSRASLEQQLQSTSSALDEESSLRRTCDAELTIAKEQHEVTSARCNSQIGELNNQVMRQQCDIEQLSQSKVALEQQLQSKIISLNEQSSLREIRETELASEKALSAHLNAQISELNIQVRAKAVEIEAVLQSNVSLEQRLQSTCSNLDQQTQLLATEKEQHAVMAASSNVQICELNDNISSKQSEIEELSQSKASLEHQLQSAFNALNEQTTLRETRDAELAAEKEQHAVTRSRFDVQVGDLNNQIKSKQYEIGELSQSRASLEQQLRSTSNALDEQASLRQTRELEFATEKEQHEETVACLSAQIGELNIQINGKQSKIEDLLQSKTSLSNAFEDQVRLRKTVETELVTLLQEQQNLSKKIAILEMEAKEMQETKIAMEAIVARKEEAFEIIEKEKAVLQHDVTVERGSHEHALKKALDVAYAATKDKDDYIEQESAKLEQINVQHKAELSKLQNTVEDLTKRLEARDSTVSVFSTEKEELARQNDALRASKDSSVKTYTNLMKKFSEAKKQLADSQKKCTYVENEKQEIRDHFDKYKNEMLSVQEVHSNLVAQLDAMTKKAELSMSLEAEKEEQQAQIDQLEDQILGLQSTVKRLQDEADTVNQLNNSLVGHNNHKQKIQLHAKIKAENKELRAENDSVKAELRTLQRECRRLTISHDKENTPFSNNIRTKAGKKNSETDFSVFKTRRLTNGARTPRRHEG